MSTDDSGNDCRLRPALARHVLRATTTTAMIAQRHFSLMDSVNQVWARDWNSREHRAWRIGLKGLGDEDPSSSSGLRRGEPED